MNAWDDHQGGVFYRTPAWEALWLPAGATTPVPFNEVVEYDPAARVIGQLFTGIVEGHPTVFFDWWRSAGGLLPADQVMTCDESQLIAMSLHSGEFSGLMCLPVEDAWFGIQSVGSAGFRGSDFDLPASPVLGCTGRSR